jgi:hypothetical protein
MSFNTTTNKSGSKVVTLSCDHKGCTVRFTGASKGEAGAQGTKAHFFQVNQGSRGDNLHFCVDHRAEHGFVGRAPKTEKAVKAGKAVAKSAKKAVEKTSTTKSGAKVSVRVSAKNNGAAKPASKAFVGGQSIGKKAKSAKVEALPAAA